MRGRTLRRFPGFGAVAFLAAIATGSCASSPDASDSSASMESRSPGPGITWSTCGTTECAALEVPLVHGAAESPKIVLDVVRRVHTVGAGKGVLVLLPDRDSGDTARQVVETAALKLGASARDYTVVSLGMRGTTEGPFPGGTVGATGSLDAVDDLEILLAAMDAGPARVIGWGSGATIAAAWEMLHPSSVAAAVLDTPADPASSMVTQGIDRYGALLRGVNAMWLWCAAHISCPLNQEPFNDWAAVTHIIGIDARPPGLTMEAIERAAYRAMTDGTFRDFFVALDEVVDDLRAERLVGMASSVAPAGQSTWRCADLRRAASKRILEAADELRPTWFIAGVESDVHESCLRLPAPSRPLGGIEPSSAATESAVFVVAARFDPVWDISASRAMAKRMKWKYKSVPATRHLVVGFDRAVTSTAMDFLGRD